MLSVGVVSPRRAWVGRSRLLRGAWLALLALGSNSAWAFEPFEVKDIRLEGLQRIPIGTVFNYLPLQIGDRMDDSKSAESIRALFKAGLFKDVQIDRDGDVLVVRVVERPAISDVKFSGNHDIETDKLKEALTQIGLAKGRTFDKSILDKVEQELQRQYFSRGKYGVKITSKVDELERNRVDIAINISEGEVARIAQVNLVGNEAFTDDELLARLQSGVPGMFGMFSSKDQYSRQKLSADLETLRSFYLDRGYANFNVESTQVAITPELRDVYVTINVSEGDKFTIKDVTISGDFKVPTEEIRQLILIQPGDVFSRKAVTESAERINQRFGKDGYSFANINPVPNIDNTNKLVSLNFFVDPGRRVYVRQINMAGNVKTRDEVLRREMRQMESGWIATDKVNRSRVRLQRLGFFEDVNVETPPVPGIEDEVDINYGVTERSSGSLQAGMGYSKSQGVLLTASVSHDNFLGSGNRVSADINTSKVNTIYSFSHTDPYYTPDGISLTRRAFYKKTKASEANTADYTADTYGIGADFGIPVTEFNGLRLGAGLENIKVNATQYTPQAYRDYLTDNGDDFNSLKLTLGWNFDSRDKAYFPDSGMFHSITAEATAPALDDLNYFKISTRHKWYYPLTSSLTFLATGQLGAGNGYGDTTGLPFWESFYAGGISTVRAFRTNSLGPAENDTPLGGSIKTVGGVELLFPPPFAPEVSSFRMSVFYDIGNVFANRSEWEAGELRSSAGISASWLSPIGPMVFSLGRPVRSQDGDDSESFQFSLGAPL